jgi:hypothetical protein
MRWLFTGKGMPTYSPSIVVASVKVLEESATPDTQVTVAPGRFKDGDIARLGGREVEPPGRRAYNCDRRRARGGLIGEISLYTNE